MLAITFMNGTEPAFGLLFFWIMLFVYMGVDSGRIYLIVSVESSPEPPE